MIVVAVLRGGVGDEHDVSLRTGMNVLRLLERGPWKPIDVYIDRSGVWHVRGVPMVPSRALSGVDVVFNALHGLYGEDGTVQRELERLSIPFTGSASYPSSVAMNKVLTKEMLKPLGIKTPYYTVLSVTPELESDIVRVFRSFPQPSVVKPLNSGSSVGVTLAQSFNEFEEAVKKAFQYAKEVIVEEYIKGRDATVGVIDDMRGKKTYQLPPVEIILPPTSRIFDFDAKYGGASEERCPGGFSRSQIEELEDTAARVHEALGLRHYSRSDFVVTPKGVYFLEANTLPGLTEKSLIPKSLDAVGIPMDEFLNHVLMMALEKK